MKELSLNILDIAENSVKANASLIQILLDETDETLSISIIDDGCGMDEETVRNVTDPFYTTRTTRSVGLGVPLIKLACEQTGGKFEIKSKPGEGTELNALFYSQHIDFTPLGDVVSTLLTLIQGHPEKDFLFLHKYSKTEVKLDTRELREQLGDIPLSTYDVIKWIEEYMNEQYEEFYKNYHTERKSQL